MELHPRSGSGDVKLFLRLRFGEIDLVSHSGDRADGEFINSLTFTDIHSTWTETRAVMGKSQAFVQEALEDIRSKLPFPMRGIDSDNGSEFINHHLMAYCKANQIEFTRSRPYKKDDNAHVEQKNWTHVRKLFGYLRYDSGEALLKINDLHRGDLRLFQNLFLPSVKLVAKKRVGRGCAGSTIPPRHPWTGCSTRRVDSA